MRRQSRDLARLLNALRLSHARSRRLQSLMAVGSSVAQWEPATQRRSPDGASGRAAYERARADLPVAGEE